VFPLNVCYRFALLLADGTDWVALPGTRCSAGVGLAANEQQRSRGKGEPSLQYSIDCKFNERKKGWWRWSCCSPQASSN
jgi:hypothetical protein